LLVLGIGGERWEKGRPTATALIKRGAGSKSLKEARAELMSPHGQLLLRFLREVIASLTISMIAGAYPLGRQCLTSRLLHGRDFVTEHERVYGGGRGQRPGESRLCSLMSVLGI
jgi:hypothetical protein